MKTRKGYGALITTLGEKYAEDDETMETLRAISADLDEKMDVIDNVGIAYDADLDEYEYAPKEINQEGNSSEWEAKYNELRSKYVARFFSKNEECQTESEETEAEEPEEKKDINNITLSDVMEEKESD